jgi:hypothetical protein
MSDISRQRLAADVNLEMMTPDQIQQMAIHTVMMNAN